MKRVPLIYLLAAFILACSPVAAQKKVAAPAAATARQNAAAGKPMELNGIRETRLPNGLTVLTKEVHAAPVVYFSVYYQVGSVNEEVGQTGMSHLMEHMMFKGTRTRGPGVISAELQRNGANFNASTSFDRTEYHETLSSDRLELAMQIESDRMVNSVYDETQHQKEMTVVRSEYEAGENNPGSALGKAVRLAAYEIHPYRWEPIGFRADIENFTRDEMYAYYKNYYTPNNATVVIVGDFDTAHALALARKYFGPIQPHPVLEHFITPEPDQQGERRVIVRRAGTVPQMQISYHVPGFGNPDRYAIEVMNTALSAGATSRLFQDLVQSGLALGAFAYHDDLRFPDLENLVATAQTGHTNEELEKALLDEVDKLQKSPITDEELNRAHNQAEARYIFGQESVQAQGSRLGENAMKGDWRYGETYVANLRKVTAADVQRVAQKYLIPSNRTVGYFEPIHVAGQRTPPPAAGPGGLTTPSVPRYQPDDTGHQSWISVKPGGTEGSPAALRTVLTSRSTYDPDSAAFPLSPPGAAPAPGDHAAGGAGAKVTKPTRVVLDNGLTVVVEENHANPTVSLSGALLSAGGVFDPPDKRGLADFTADQLARGTRNRSFLDISRTLEDVGASVSVSSGDEYVSLGGHALSKNFDTILDVLSDELRHPSFPAVELERSRSQALAGIEQERQDTGTLASIAFSDALFPAGHPYHSPTLDQQAAFIQGLTRDDLVSFHDAHYAPDRMILVIVGDVTTGDAIDAVKKYFGDWPKKGNLPAISIPDTPMPTGPAKPIVIFVPDKTQTDVLYGYPGELKRSDPAFYAVTVLDDILGGSGLSSRLMLNVRDRMGLVYGIYANTDASLGEGPFQVQLGSNPANVDKAVAAMQEQLQLIHDHGATKEEVAEAIDYLTGSYAVRLATNAGVAGQLLVSQIYNLGLDYIQKHNSFYRNVTPAQVNAAARTYLFPDRGTLVIAGTYKGKYGGE